MLSAAKSRMNIFATEAGFRLSISAVNERHPEMRNWGSVDLMVFVWAGWKECATAIQLIYSQSPMMKARQFKHEGFVESGKDGRFRVKEDEVSQQPYSQIGALLYRHPLTGKLKLGTGFAITPDLVFTVAHNIFVPQIGPRLLERTEMRFYPGQTGRFHRDSGWKVIDIRMPAQFSPHVEEKYDYALLKLEKSVNGLPGIELLLDYKSGVQAQVAVFGYPGDKISYLQSETTQIQELSLFGKKGKADSSDDLILHSVDTSEGQSGSPILIEYQGRLLAAGMHKAYSYDHQLNAGMLFTPEMMVDLFKWEKEMILSQIKLKQIKNDYLLDLGDQDFALMMDQRIKSKEAQIKQQLQALSAASTKSSTKDTRAIGEYDRFGVQWDRSINRLSVFDGLFFSGDKYYNIKDNRISRNHEDVSFYYQIVSTKPIPKNRIQRISATVLKQKSTLIFGLIVDSRRNERFSGWREREHIGSIGYETSRWKAFINANGVQSQEAPVIQDGQSITMEVDQKEMKVMWIVQGEIVGKTDLGNNFKDKSLLVFVAMNWQGTTVEMIS